MSYKTNLNALSDDMERARIRYSDPALEGAVLQASATAMLAEQQYIANLLKLAQGASGRVAQEAWGIAISLLDLDQA